MKETQGLEFTKRYQDNDRRGGGELWSIRFTAPEQFMENTRITGGGEKVGISRI